MKRLILICILVFSLFSVTAVAQSGTQQAEVTEQENTGESEEAEREQIQQSIGGTVHVQSVREREDRGIEVDLQSDRPQSITWTAVRGDNWGYGTVVVGDGEYTLVIPQNGNKYGLAAGGEGKFITGSTGIQINQDVPYPTLLSLGGILILFSFVIGIGQLTKRKAQSDKNAIKQ